jgi:SnoaL-like domain
MTRKPLFLLSCRPHQTDYSLTGTVRPAHYLACGDTNVGSGPGGKEYQFTALATNVYEFRDGHWLMVVHHASLVPQPQ